MESPNVPTPPPRRPGPTGVHRLALGIASLAALATIAGAAVVSGGVAPAAASATTQSAGTAADVAPVPEILVHTVYVPAPQPSAAPELPVKVIVINKASSGEEDEGHESGGD